MAPSASLITYLTMWYVGNYWYNIYNKTAGKLSGGANFAFTNATMQLVIGCAYAIFLWLAPDARKQPTLTLGQFMSLAPLGFFAAVAHGGAVYAMSAGAVSFGQIVKAGEPVFAAAVGYFVYKKSESVPKLICLLPVIGGIAIASMQELDFTMASLIAASTANVASAFRGSENKRVMTGELSSAIGSGGNSYALTTIWATILLTPTVFISGEFDRIDEYLALLRSDSTFRYNLLMSGVTFYLYNEVSTKCLTGKDGLSGVSHSVANTAKRAVVIVGSALAFGEDMGFLKSVGCTIAIAGTFLYAIADSIPGYLGFGKKAKSN